MTDRTFPVYLPAGADPSNTDDPLLVKAGVDNKALIRIHGKQLVDYVLEAVDQADTVEKIFIVGLSASDIEYSCDTPVRFIEAQGSRMENLERLMTFLIDEYGDNLPRHVMSFSTDIPLITTEMIDTTIDQLENELGDKFDEIDLFYPLIPKDIFVDKYPDAKKHFRKFTEGKYATGDYMLFSPQILLNEQTMEATKNIMSNRKQMLKILIKFDWLAPIKYIFGWLSARDDIFPFVEEEFDVKAEMMVSEYPEIGLDIDYPDDLEKFEQLIANPS